MTSIGSYAFSGCTGLTSIICLAQNTPKAETSSFTSETYLTGTLYVLNDSKILYENVSPWKSFKNIIGFEEYIAIQGIELNYQEVELQINETVQLEARLFPEDATIKNVTWHTSDNDVVSVSEEGLITAISEGMAIITATCGDLSTSCEITVLEDAGVENLLANPNSVVSIFTMDGILHKKDVYIEEIKTLSKGFYILKSGNRSYKIAI